ncbi:type I-U CRISPR-associated protein Csb2 [Streptosporangium lutulentum]
MLTVALHFPWRRYHATPWGKYVNEGAVELPPSPWRLLRALYSTWKLRIPDLPEEQVHDLLSLLAQPPSYTLPPYRPAHSRHYYPDSKHRAGKPSTDKVIDAFVALGGDATIYAHWSLTLTPQQQSLLERLLQSLPYLGRADSICEARLAPDWTPSLDGPPRLAVPTDLSDEELNGHEEIDLLVPELPLDIVALTARPADIRAAKLLYPPATRLISYTLPGPGHDLLPASKPTGNRKRSISHRTGGNGGATNVTAVRIAVAGTAQPSIRATVALTDAFRAAAVKELSGIRQAKATSLLAGKNHDDTPLTYHQHAHFLPWDQDGDRRIDEILLWVPGGLDDDELQALDKLAGRSVGTPKNVPGPKDLQVRIAAYGTAETILPAQLRGPYRQWRSVTPFVPYRHRKRHQEMDDYLTAEITRELTQRGIPAPICVSRDATDDWPLFTRHRWSRSNRTEARPGYGLTLEFAEPVSGPLALGHLSHFGLGVFRQQPHP